MLTSSPVTNTATPAVWQRVVPGHRRVVMWGAGDQGRISRPILQEAGVELVALVDDTPGLQSPFSGVPVLQGWQGLLGWTGREGADFGFVIAIGNPYGHVRCMLHDRLVGLGLKPVSIADSSVLIRASAVLGEGLQAMPGAIVHNDARIGRQCIVNTRALVEHDCILEEGVEIGPGATLCGRIRVGANTWIGAGATIRPRVNVGRNCIIGAGAVVVSDMPDGCVAVGVPACPVGGKSTPSADHAAGRK